MTEEYPITDPERYGFPEQYEPDSYTSYYADRYFNTEKMLQEVLKQ